MRNGSTDRLSGKQLMRRTQPTRSTLPGLLLAASAVLPLSATAVADDAAISSGREVFESVAGIGCKSCHGDFAEGDLGVGPYIRGATEGSIRAAIEGIGEMVVIKNVISDEQIDAVVAYMNYLGSMQAVRTLSKRGRFLPESVSTRPGTPVQLIIKNSGIKPASYQSDNMGIDPFTVGGRSTDSLEWRAPEQPGEYSIYCIDCKLKDQFFVIDVNLDAPEFGGVARERVASGTGGT